MYYFVKTSKMQQGTLCFMITDIARCTSCDDYNVQTTIEHVFMQSVTFPNQSGDSVPHNAVANLFADRNTETILLQTVLLHI